MTEVTKHEHLLLWSCSYLPQDVLFAWMGSTDNLRIRLRGNGFLKYFLLEVVDSPPYSIHWFSLFFLRGSKMSAQHCPLFISLLMGHFKHFRWEECWCHEYVSSQHLVSFIRSWSSVFSFMKREYVINNSYYRELAWEDSSMAFCDTEAIHTE